MHYLNLLGATMTLRISQRCQRVVLFLQHIAVPSSTPEACIAAHAAPAVAVLDQVVPAQDEGPTPEARDADV
jgi:hypothetical protein